MNPLIYLSLFYLLIPYTVDSKQKIDTDLKKMIKPIEQLNQLESSPKECQHCLRFSKSDSQNESIPDQEDEDLLQQCAVDLCGPANENPRYVFDNFTFDKEDIDPETIKSFQEEVLPVIERAIQNALDRNKHILHLFAEMLKTYPNNINQYEWDWATTIAYETVSPLKDIRRAYSERDFPYIREKYYEKLVREYENNKTKFTEKDREKIIQLDQSLENGDLNMSLVVTLDDLIKKSKTSNCLEDSTCKQWVYSKLSNLYQEYARTVQNQEDNIQQHIRYCQSVYISEIKNPHTFRKDLESYKDKFLNRSFFNYSSLSRQFFGNYMNKVLKFKIPPSQSNQQRFINTIQKAQQSYVQLTQHSSNRFIPLERMVSGQPKGEQQFISLICPSNLKRQFGKDSFSPKKNRVSLSLFSCIFHEHGKNFLAHELAHAMSYLFANNKLSETSYGKYKELRECVNNRYTDKAPDTFSKPSRNSFSHNNNDKIKTEEDTADLIAYSVFQDSAELLGCGFLTSSKNGERYESLTMLQSKHKHSAPLLRVIMHAIHKRQKLSETCQKVVDIYSDRINFEPCF